MEPGEGGSGTFATPRMVTDVADCDFWRTGVDPDQPTMTLLAAEQRRLGADDGCFHWWQTTPGLVGDRLSRFGFRTVERYQHRQSFAESGASVPHFTVVARREAGAADPGSAGPGR